MAAGVLWLLGLLILPRSVQKAWAGWWNGILIPLFAVGLSGWAGTNGLHARRRRDLEDQETRYPTDSTDDD
jgi:hypothetical protein